jgi:hypothetical protein
MIDFEILKEFGTTDDRLREFFTAVAPTAAREAKMTKAEINANRRDVAQRDKFQKWVQGVLYEHICTSLSNHQKYSAVDMAWDSMPINTAVVPLMQYAQGRIGNDRIGDVMKDVPNADQYLRKDGEGKVVGVDLPKFYEVNVNLLRSVITRRRAAQVQKYDRLFPYYKYEPRDQTQVGKLRADVVSQRMEIMADQFDYRHHGSQEILNMLLYSQCVSFPRAYWEREMQLEREPGPIKTDEKGNIRKRSRIVREGIAWVAPHPSRVFYDNQYPITTLNSDIGCEYVGFWDVTRWGDIANNSDYFNRKKVSYTSGMCDLFTTYWSYFNQYFTTITPPTMNQAGAPENTNETFSTTAANDRKNRIGLFVGGSMEQVSTIFTHLWVKVRPQNWGWGRYPYPIWVHLKVAGDSTVVYAKIIPSSPASVSAYNQHDGRLMNISLAHELIPFQDQLTNLFSQLLETVKQDLFSVCILNTDVFPDTAEGKAALKQFEEIMQNKAKYCSMQMLEISFQKLAALGIKPDQAFTTVRTKPNTAIEAIFKAITEVLNMADRLQVMSQQEVGQQMTHEVSATESNNISKSTDTVYDFISTGIDEGRAAKKRICYESLVACGSDDVELTVSNRYPPSIVSQTGFTATDDQLNEPVGFSRLTGNKSDLVHDYCFTSRDGGDRPAGQQAATVLVQMLQSIGQLEPQIQQAVVGAMGKAKVFEILNTIFHSIDAGVDLNLEVKPGENDNLLISQEKQFTDMVHQLAKAVQNDTMQIGQMHQLLQALTSVIAQQNPQAAQMIQAEMQKNQPPQQPQQGPAGPQTPPPQM